MSASRNDQTARTRKALIDTAERLFALNGIAAVSSRQISKEAGQGNNYAVGHHFGGKAELVRAILDHHEPQINERRQAALADMGESTEVRDWIRCLVAPQLNYLDTLGAPTYFARFTSQVASDPAMMFTLYDAMASSEPLPIILDGFYKALPDLPQTVVSTRDDMTRHTITASFADFERSVEMAAARGEAPDMPWSRHAEIVVDAMTGLWLAPVTSS